MAQVGSHVRRGPLDLERDLRARARRRPVAYRSGLVVLLSRTLSAQRCVPVLALLPLAAGVTEIWGDPAGAAALLVSTYAWCAAVTPVLDAFLDQDALRRTYAHRPRLGAELALTTTLLAVSFTLLSGFLAGLDVWYVLAAVLVAAVAWGRRAQGRRLAGRVGALLATPAGGIPMDIASRVVAGPDALVGGLILLTVTTPRTTCLLLAVLLLGVGTRLYRQESGA